MQSDSQYDSLSNPGNATHYVQFLNIFLHGGLKKSTTLNRNHILT